MKATALVLAAGASRRAGGVNKLLAADPAGRAMVVRTIATALQSQASEVVVVLGHDAASLAAAIEAASLAASRPGELERLHCVHAGDHAAGLSASLRCGVGHAAAGAADAILVCLGDMPMVRASTLDRLMQGLAGDPDALACAPLWGGRRGNPVIWRRPLFGALLALSGDKGGRGLLDRHAAAVRELAVDDPGVLLDFDTPDRLAAYTKGEPISPFG